MGGERAARQGVGWEERRWRAEGRGEASRGEKQGQWEPKRRHWQQRGRGWQKAGGETNEHEEL